MKRISTYESDASSRRFGAIMTTKEDDLFVTKLLSTFVNKQSALFQRWVKVRITENNNGYNEFTRYTSNNQQTYGSKQPKSQLLVLTPLKIISLPTIASPKRMKQFKIIDIISLFIEENTNYVNSSDKNYDYYLNVKNKKKTSKKLTKPKKRTISNNNVIVIQNNVNNPKGLKYPKIKKKERKRKKDKVLASYPIVQHKPNFRNDIEQTQNIKILSNGGINGYHKSHHPQASSSSQSHSLSPPPSTSLDQPTFNDFAATDDDNNNNINNTSVSALIEDREFSTTPSYNSNRSTSRSNASNYNNVISSLGGYNGWIYHCSIKFHKLEVLEMSYDKLLSHNSDNLEHDILDIYFESKDVAKEFLDILQFYLFTLYRGVPCEYKPKIEIIPNALNDDTIQYIESDIIISDDKKKQKKNQKYPFVPSQVFIDRYVAYCDAQKIQALDSVIDYVIHTNNDDIFDVAAAFSHQILLYRNGSHHPIARSDDHNTNYTIHDHNTILKNNFQSLDMDNGHNIKDNKQLTKNIQQQQYVALSHALAFLKMYKHLCVDRLNTDDSNIATLMKIFETNPYICACEFRKCAIKKITMQSLSWSLRTGVSNLKELCIYDINISKSTLKDLDLDPCNLNKLVMSKCNMSEKTCVYLFNQLIKTQQYKSMLYLNISYNHCDKEGTKILSSFIYQTLNIQTLIVNDSRIDGNIFFNGLHINNYNNNNMRIKHHLQCLLYLDFSGNFIGDHGARKLSNFIQSAQSLQCLKLSRCNMSTQQLHKIFEGALANNSCIDDINNNNNNDNEDDIHQFILNQQEEEKKYDNNNNNNNNNNDDETDDISPIIRKNTNTNNKKTVITAHQSQNDSVLLGYRPTRCDIIQLTNLMRLTLDLSYNNLGSKGSNIICELLRNRLIGGNIGNYTIVSLSLSGNNFDIINLSNISNNLHCCICLESLNISDNITKQKLINYNNYSFGKGKKKDKDKDKDKNKNKEKGLQILGHSLVNLCRRATKLERLIMNTNDLSLGLESFLSSIAYLSNLKFIDLSNNKFNDKHITILMSSLSYNRTFIRALKINNNKISSQCLIEYLQLLSNHTSLIDVNTCLPMEHIIKYKKIKKYSATFTRLQNEASLNLRGNKFQYDIDKKMVSSLPIRERLEKELRLQCGQQFGIPLECVRGTIKFKDYSSRIPKILINLRSYLKSKGGFKTREIFRFHADSQQFNKFKQDLNANNKNAKTDDTHSIANAIKAFYHDLPIKVLNNVNISILSSAKTISDINKIMFLIKEPYKSLFEWLLDLCVDIVIREKINKMSHRSMAVVLCPSLYNAFSSIPTNQTSKILRAVMEFTDLAIQHRIIYRKNNKCKYEEEIIADPNIQLQLMNIDIIKQQTNIIKYSYQQQILLNKWNNVMKDFTKYEIEQQAWNNCNNNQHCYSIDRLTFILTYYKKWLIKRNINPHRQSTFGLKLTKEINKYNHCIIDFIQSLRNYSNIQLINDFNHILTYHSTDEELEIIMYNLRKAMGNNICINISQCTAMKRQNRNRDQDENRPWKMKTYFGYKQSKEICTQQILDKIHCYFFHTFDTLRLTKNEKIKLENIITNTNNNNNNKSIYKSRKSTLSRNNQLKQDQKLEMLSNILIPKSDKLIQIRGRNRIKGTKFHSNISLFIKRINNNQSIYIDDDDDDDDEEDNDYCTLGQTFNYFGTSLKDQQERPKTSSIWYINKKYNHFKEELLHNNIKTITCDIWNDIYEKATILQQSTIAKQIQISQKINTNTNTNTNANSPTPQPQCDDNNSSGDDQIIEMKNNNIPKEIQIIPIQHLMAVLLYCDFDYLRLSLNEIFYPKEIDETITNWKLRNAEYCYWTQYLRDVVMNSNGIDISNNNNNNNNNNDNIYYHSTTNQTYLSPKCLQFCYPMSCNKHLSIVHIFAPKNGIIFALKSKGDNISHFNCNWISDYANYDENIIFGTNKYYTKSNIFEINNIISIETSQNYKSFWNAINILYLIINNDYNTRINDNNNEEDMNCLSLLIQSQILEYNRKKINKLIPPYIQSLFSSFCRDYINEQIILNHEHFILLPTIYKYLFDEFGFCKIDLFCNLFINISHIKILNVIINDNIFDTIYKFLLQFFNNTQQNTKRRGAIAMQKRKSSVLDSIKIITNTSNDHHDTITNITHTSSLSLNTIQLCISKNNINQCKESVNKYKQNLNDIGWNINYTDHSLYIDKQ